VTVSTTETCPVIRHLRTRSSSCVGPVTLPGLNPGERLSQGRGGSQGRFTEASRRRTQQPIIVSSLRGPTDYSRPCAFSRECDTGSGKRGGERTREFSGFDSGAIHPRHRVCSTRFDFDFIVRTGLPTRSRSSNLSGSTRKFAPSYLVTRHVTTSDCRRCSTISVYATSSANGEL